MTSRPIDSSILSDDERAVLTKICDEIGVPADVVERMIIAENRVYGMGRRHGIWEALEPLVEEGVQRQSGQEPSEDLT